MAIYKDRATLEEFVSPVALLTTSTLTAMSAASSLGKLRTLHDCSIRITGLPVQPYSKLNLARARLRGCYSARCSNCCARLAEDGVIAQRRGTVCVVQDIEELGAELHAEAFRNTWDGYVFVGRHIQVEQAGTRRNISARVTQSRDRVRQC